MGSTVQYCCWLLLLLGRQGWAFLPTAAFLPVTKSSIHSSSPCLSSCGESDNRFTLPIDDAASVLGKSLTDHVTALVDDRAAARTAGNYSHADRLLEQIYKLALPAPHLQLVLQDIPRDQGGGTTWNLQLDVPLQLPHAQRHKSSVLQLAHAALGWTVAKSQQQRSTQMHPQDQEALVQEAKQQLQAWYAIHQSLHQKQQHDNSNGTSHNPLLALLSSILNKDDHASTTNTTTFFSDWQVDAWMAVEGQIRGRKAADAAFWFASAGVNDQELFQLLTQFTYKEVQRYGRRSSCQAKNLLQICDRLAAAGIRSQMDDGVGMLLEQEVWHCLQLKQQNEGTEQEAEDGASGSLLDLHSDRCLLRIWKFSARQTKQQAFLSSAKHHWEGLDRQQQKQEKGDTGQNSNCGTSGTLFRQHPEKQEHNDNFYWQRLFSDPTRPLILDLGCGFGVSLLGLASLSLESDHSDNHGDQEIVSPILQHPLPDCNFLGVDWSGLAIGYAQGIANRWGLADRCQFVVERAETILQRVAQSYPGPVQLCMVQFPTPYRLVTEGNGNSQLPKSATDGFMVSPDLLRQAYQVLQPSQGRLLVQSNCEDVALWIQQTACSDEVSFQAQPLDHHVVESNDNAENHHYVGVELPLRTQQWIAMGGNRATGNIWSVIPLLPRKGATETEVACRINKTPVHRCLLAPKQ